MEMRRIFYANLLNDCNSLEGYDFEVVLSECDSVHLVADNRVILRSTYIHSASSRVFALV